MESRTKNKKSREEIKQLVERAFPGLTIAEGEAGCRELTEGYFNAAYCIQLSDGRNTVLKIAPSQEAEVLTYEKNMMVTEVAMMRLIKEQTDVRLPEVYYYDNSKEFCDVEYFFMEKLEGENYINIKSGLPKEEIIQIDRQMGDCNRKMNEITGTYFGYPGLPELQGDHWKEVFLKIMDSVLEDGKRKQAEIGQSYEEVWELIQRHAECLDGYDTPHFVHWDVWDANVFVVQGELVGIIDFERALWGDPLLEPIFRQFDPDVPEYWTGYGKTVFSEVEQRRCKLYSLHIYLIMAIECFYRIYDNNDQYQFALSLIADTMDWLRNN